MDFGRIEIIKGGPGSGHYGHRGRPGIRGGSAPSGGIIIPSDRLRIGREPVHGVAVNPLDWSEERRLAYAEPWRNYDFWNMVGNLKELPDLEEDEAYGSGGWDMRLLLADENMQAIQKFAVWPEESDSDDPHEWDRARIEAIATAPWNLLGSTPARRRVTSRGAGLRQEDFPQQPVRGSGTALFMSSIKDVLDNYPNVTTFGWESTEDAASFYRLLGLTPRGLNVFTMPRSQAADIAGAYFEKALKTAEGIDWEKVFDAEEAAGPLLAGKLPKEIVKGGPGSGHFLHRGRPGKRGGSAPSGLVTEKYLFDPESPGYSLLHTDALWADPAQTWRHWLPTPESTRQTIAGVLLEYPMPERHLHDLAFSNRSAGGGVEDWHDIDILGYYTRFAEAPGLAVASLSPAGLRSSTLDPPHIVLHEIGHHVVGNVNREAWNREVDYEGVRVSADEALVLDMIEVGKLGKADPKELASRYGLRELGQWAGEELPADAYVVSLRGSPRQQRNLEREFNKAAAFYGLPEFQELFR